MHNSRWAIAAAASLLLGCALPVGAQGYPSKPVRVIVPYAPGGGGVIGADIAARAPADGHTVLLAVPAEMVILPHLQKMPYRVDRDFAPVSLAALTPLIFVVHPTLPVKTVQNVVTLAKSRPGQLTYASAGTGGVQHLAGELFKITAKIDLLHVPYKGAGPVIPDLLGGHVPMFFSGIPPAMPHVRAGKLRALAVTTAKRSPAVPDVPTMQESGMPAFDISNWFAYFVPDGTPAETIAKLNSEINRALKLQDVRESSRA